MTFNIDEAIDGILPWDLTLVVGGECLATRRPTLAEFGKIMRMGELSDEEGGKLLASVFDPPMEPREFLRMGNASIVAVMVTYLTYFKSRALKNPMAIAEQVRAAIAATKKKD